jgi:RIO-like serine/threonine protein kinase
MVQEDLTQKKYMELHAVLLKLLSQKKHNIFIQLIRNLAQLIEDILAIDIYNEDFNFNNVMVNGNHELALIDFERFFKCRNKKEKSKYTNQTVSTCMKMLKKITDDESLLNAAFETLSILQRQEKH